MDTAPLVFRVAGKPVNFPRDPASLPGLSPAAVDKFLDITAKYAVDPKTVDIAQANLAGARFAVEVSAYSVAETLRRLDGGASVDPYLAAVRDDHEFEQVTEAFGLVVKRNPKVFTPAKPEASPGN